MWPAFKRRLTGQLSFVHVIVTTSTFAHGKPYFNPVRYGRFETLVIHTGNATASLP